MLHECGVLCGRHQSNGRVQPAMAVYRAVSDLCAHATAERFIIFHLGAP